MTDKQLKLEKIINEIDELYGFGNGFIDKSTDVDKFIEDFKHKFLVKYDLSHILNIMNESTGKSYIEQLNEI